MFDGMSGVDTCLDPVILSFLATGNTKTLDAGCVSTMKPPAFWTGSQQAEAR